MNQSRLFIAHPFYDGPYRPDSWNRNLENRLDEMVEHLEVIWRFWF